MVTAPVLYTPQVLGLATSLAAWPLTDDLPLTGRARSTSCGSTLTVGLDLDSDGRIARTGVAAQACAMGQAAAAVFLANAPGRIRTDIAMAEQAIAAWLAGRQKRPDWPDLAIIEPAVAYPARHGAILLPWRAALDALPLDPAAR